MRFRRRRSEPSRAPARGYPNVGSPTNHACTVVGSTRAWHRTTRPPKCARCAGSRCPTTTRRRASTTQKAPVRQMGTLGRIGAAMQQRKQARHGVATQPDGPSDRVRDRPTGGQRRTRRRDQRKHDRARRHLQSAERAPIRPRRRRTWVIRPHDRGQRKGRRAGGEDRRPRGRERAPARGARAPRVGAPRSSSAAEWLSPFDPEARV